jgi:hypothetical protein
MEWKNRKTHWYEAVSSALSIPFSKEVSQNYFVFAVGNFENRGCLAEFRRFGAVTFLLLRKPRRIALFWIDR